MGISKGIGKGNVTRRQFTATLASGLGATPLLHAIDPAAGSDRAPGNDGARSWKRPVVISSVNGYHFGATEVAYQKLLQGADTLDAVIAGVNRNELDPNDMTVGYGGLPNEEGVVQLDACCMHGPTMLAGAVGGLEGCKTPSLVARAVMEHTDEIFLVGEGAGRFARAMGFPQENLLTEKARKTWMLWRETRSLRDSWGPGLLSPDYEEYQRLKRRGAETALPGGYHRQMKSAASRLGIPEEDQELAIRHVLSPPTGTINCLAVNAKGEISGVTTTSGLAWKIPGRVGDSPIIGAGCYVDGEVGGAGSTGRGEANIRIDGGHTVVELMREGKSPREACLEALRRVQHLYRHFPERLQLFDLQFYALRVDGAYAAATLWRPKSDAYHQQFAVNDGMNRVEEMAWLLERLA